MTKKTAEKAKIVKVKKPKSSGTEKSKAQIKAEADRFLKELDG